MQPSFKKTIKPSTSIPLNIQLLIKQKRKIERAFIKTRNPFLISALNNAHLEISASASALTLASASALQNFFFVLRSFYFCFSKYNMKKTSMVKSFSSTLAHIPGSFSRCLEQLFCRKPVSTCF